MVEKRAKNRHVGVKKQQLLSIPRDWIKYER